MKSLPVIGLLTVTGLSLSGCWVGSDSQACSGMSEQKGQDVARAAVKHFLQYAGKTHSPMSGPSGTLDSARLENVSDGDLVYDGRKPAGSNTYTFHLLWAPQAKFISTVGADCTASNNWTIG